MACTLFKLTHGAFLFVCSEIFVVKKSIVSLIVRDVVFAINKALRHKIAWPCSECLRGIQVEFFDLYELPIVLGAIDGTHVLIFKPHVDSVDYFYFKSSDYTINC